MLPLYQAIGLTERQFNELMIIPHTFFYLRVRKDSVLDSKAANQQRPKTKENFSYGKLTTSLAVTVNSENGSEEYKSMNQTLQQPAQIETEEKLFLGSQSTNALFDLRGNGQQNVSNDSDQTVKKLAWTGKIPVRGAQAKKLLVTSMSSLAISSLMPDKSRKTTEEVASGPTSSAFMPPPAPPPAVQSNEAQSEALDDAEEIPAATMNGIKDAFERSVGVGGSVYDLEMATQDTIDLNFYFTLSKEGVTQYSHKSSQFTSLAQWHREYLLFHRISAIRYVVKHFDAFFCTLICVRSITYSEIMSPKALHCVFAFCCIKIFQAV
jgi:hypothetical protein